MRTISLLLMLQLMSIVLFSQNQNKLNITPGLYQVDDRLNFRSGQLLLKPDSTLLFFGISTIPVNPCFTAYFGSWRLKSDTLCFLFTPFADENLSFYNSETTYQSESRPPYDSVHINLEIQNENGNPKDILFMIGRNMANTSKGQYKVTIAAKDFPMYNSLLIHKSESGVPKGGFYGTQLTLDPKNNMHLIKIKLHSLSKLPIMMRSFADSTWKCHTYKNQVNEELIFEYRFKLKKETNLNALNSLMERAIQNNPTFKPFLDKINLELKSGL